MSHLHCLWRVTGRILSIWLPELITRANLANVSIWGSPAIQDMLVQGLQSRGSLCPACLAGKSMNICILCCCVLMLTLPEWATEQPPKITPSGKLTLRREKCNVPKISHLGPKDFSPPKATKHSTTQLLWEPKSPPLPKCASHRRSDKIVKETKQKEKLLVTYLQEV